MNIHSLKRTCPTAEILEPVQVKGFKRIFNKPATNYTALNVIQTHNNQDSFNAVIIEVSNKDEFEELLQREEGYDKIKLSINKKEVIVFSSSEEYSLYKYETQRQKEYLQTCMHGAQCLGEDFYKEFLQTTYIEETLLAIDFEMVAQIEQEEQEQKENK